MQESVFQINVRYSEHFGEKVWSTKHMLQKHRIYLPKL